MKPIERIREVFNWLCLKSFDKTITFGRKALYTLCGSAVFLSNVYALITSVEFFRKKISVDLEECLFALFQILGCFAVTYTTVAMFLQRDKITKIFQTLTDIYKKCNGIISTI